MEDHQRLGDMVRSQMFAGRSTDRPGPGRHASRVKAPAWAPTLIATVASLFIASCGSDFECVDCDINQSIGTRLVGSIRLGEALRDQPRWSTPPDAPPLGWDIYGLVSTRRGEDVNDVACAPDRPFGIGILGSTGLTTANAFISRCASLVDCRFEQGSTHTGYEPTNALTLFVALRNDDGTLAVGREEFTVAEENSCTSRDASSTTQCTVDRTSCRDEECLSLRLDGFVIKADQEVHCL